MPSTAISPMRISPCSSGNRLTALAASVAVSSRGSRLPRTPLPSSHPAKASDSSSPSAMHRTGQCCGTVLGNLARQPFGLGLIRPLIIGVTFPRPVAVCPRDPLKQPFQPPAAGLAPCLCAQMTASSSRWRFTSTVPPACIRQQLAPRIRIFLQHWTMRRMILTQRSPGGVCANRLSEQAVAMWETRMWHRTTATERGPAPAAPVLVTLTRHGPVASCSKPWKTGAFGPDACTSEQNGVRPNARSAGRMQPDSPDMRSVWKIAFSSAA